MNIIDKIISTEATRDNVRLLIPIMIYWAKTGQTHHTYEDLALIAKFYNLKSAS